jgi:hypothetical protein
MGLISGFYADDARDGIPDDMKVIVLAERRQRLTGSEVFPAEAYLWFPAVRRPGIYARAKDEFETCLFGQGF